MAEREDESGDDSDGKHDVAERAQVRVTPPPAAAVPALSRARRREEHARLGRLTFLFLVWVRQQERGNVDVVVDVKVGERDLPHPRPAYRPRSRKQRMAAGGIRPSRGSPLAARRRRSVLEIASGGIRTCSTRHPAPGASGWAMSARLTITIVARSRMTS